MDTDLSFVSPLIDLWQNQDVQEKLQETAKLYYSNAILTVDLWPYIGWGAFLIFGAIGVMMLLDSGLLDSGAASSGYGSSYSRAGSIAGLQAQVQALQESDAALRESYGYSDGSYAGYDVSGAQSIDAAGYAVAS